VMLWNAEGVALCSQLNPRNLCHGDSLSFIIRLWICAFSRADVYSAGLPGTMVPLNMGGSIAVPVKVERLSFNEALGRPLPPEACIP